MLDITMLERSAHERVEARRREAAITVLQREAARKAGRGRPPVHRHASRWFNRLTAPGRSGSGLQPGATAAPCCRDDGAPCCPGCCPPCCPGCCLVTNPVPPGAVPTGAA